MTATSDYSRPRADLRDILPADLLVAKLRAFAGCQTLSPGRVDVAPFLSSFTEFVRHTLDGRIEVVEHVDPACLPWHVDREALQEALVELVVNARDAMPDGGRLSFRASARPRNPTSETALEIADTGVGMTAAVLAMATTPFFTTRQDSPLAGMGLPAVVGFVTQSGGSISLSSTVGHGTSVKLTLPSESAAPRSRARRDSA